MITRAIPSQKWRAFFLLLYLALLLAVSKYAFGEWLPPASGGKAVWFYTGLASLLLGNHLVTPYFSKPVDAISYAVASAAALLGAEELAKWSDLEKAAYYSVMIYCLLVLVFSFLAIFTRNNQGGWAEKISRTSTVFAATFGNHRAIFGFTMLIAAYLFHRDSVLQTFLICSVCLIGVVARPDEVLSGFLSSLRKIWSGTFTPVNFGEIVGIQTPNLYLVRQNDSIALPFGTPVAIKVAGKSVFAAISLDSVGRDEANLLRCIDAKAISNSVGLDTSYAHIADETVSLITTDSNAESPLTQAAKVCNTRLVGLVAQDTSNERLYFEVVTTQELLQGMLVEVKVQGVAVIYQVLDGLTKEEIVYQKNTYGVVRAQAKKIGIWQNDSDKFIPSKWLPSLNEPVFIASPSQNVLNEQVIGCFPGGSFPVKLKSIDHLVTHNTAILGILGVGKSMLAIELIERMIVKNIKVICLDLTDQYADEMSSYYDKSAEEAQLNALYSIGAAGKTNVKLNVEEGGSVHTIRTELIKEIDSFMKSNTRQLMILNPAKFFGWKQDSKPFNNNASMLPLSTCQITQLVSEVALEYVQALGVIDSARLCLVYEEAHSLVPEWNSVAFEGDKTATAGTSRAILQGRKFGMGCLLITQRTANVTKTILNQCNTIFAMRTFDDTGKEFLSNYVGREYADTLSSLPERQAVFFGRASSCENPVLISLNDRDKFREIFRAKFPPPKLSSLELASSNSIQQNSNTFDDDIPF